MDNKKKPRSIGMTGKTHTDETKQKISEKMLNSLNAEYWTAELVESTLFEMIEFLNEDYEIEVSVKKKTGEKGKFTYNEEQIETRKRRHHTKATLLQKYHILNPCWFSEMAEKFRDNKTISLMLDSITIICENNVYQDAANGAVNAGVASLLLMSKHNWKSRLENAKKENEIPDEEIEQRLKDYETRNK